MISSLHLQHFLNIVAVPNNVLVYTPPHPLSAGGGFEPPTNFSKRGGARQDLNIERGFAGKQWGNFFQGGCNFYKKLN